ncbi:hypothetical protein ACPV52_20785, partial [Vibrio astriarenae]
MALITLAVCNRGSAVCHMSQAPKSTDDKFSLGRMMEHMKILVPVKRVVDHNVKVRVKADNTGVDITNVKM